MDPITIAAIASATSSAGGGVLNAVSQSRQNKKNRQFAVDMWNRQNEYNTPQMQMQRFKEAGLNPNLIYGQGNAGNAGAVQSPEMQAPQWGDALSKAVPAGVQAITSMYDLDLKSAQTDNLHAQNVVLQNEASLKAAQVAKTLTEGQRADFDLAFEKELRQISADARKEALRQLRTNTELSINRDAREAASVSQSIEESFERVLNMRVVRDKDEAEIARIKQNISLMAKDGTLKDIEINLRKAGINPNSGIWEKAVGSIISNAIDADFSKEDIQQLGSKIKDGIWNWLF